MKQLIHKTLFFSLFLITGITAQNFVTTWETTGAAEQITIPTTGAGYNYTVDWGDGNSDAAQTGSAFHTYAAAGTHTVTISGTFPRIYFNDTGDKLKIRSIEEWGSSIAWTSMSSAFEGCDNLVNNATDTPDLSGVTDVSLMFASCSAIGTGTATNWNSWNTSNITNTYWMFFSDLNFNQDIGNWNTEAVTNMSGMFLKARKFNQDIGSWNTGAVTDMSSLFGTAVDFNQNIGNWNTAKVTNMSGMFNAADSFNQDIDSWNVSAVTNMSKMFYSADSFNQDIDSWNTAKVTNLNAMFYLATNFNQNISSWNTGAVTNLSYMFYNATVFNQNISSWNTGAVTNLSYMFYQATNFNQNISSWNTGAVTDMSYMFSNATSFNQNISSWNVAEVTNMKEMFRFVTLSTGNYEALLTGWDTQTLKSGVRFHAGNSTYCSTAAQTARANMIASDSWIITDGGLNCDGTYFITTWKTDNAGSSNSTSISIPTTGAGYNYDVDWNNDGTFEETGVTGSVTHDFGATGTYTIRIRGDFPRIYFNNGGDKNKILSVEQWGTISWTSMDSAFEGCDNLVNNATDTPDLSGVTSFASMFRYCSNIGTGTATNWNSWTVSSITRTDSMFYGTAFNKNISSWNVANVTFMSYMFFNATSFNQNIGSWNVGKVTNMYRVFYGATAFNQNLGSWNVAAVTDMNQIFFNVTLSTANYDALLTGWNALSLKNGVTFSGGNSKYGSQAAIDARANMVASDSWTITDGGQTDNNWTGATDTDWATATNWDYGVPGNSQNLVIPDLANDPIISSTTGAVANNITITNGVLSINSGGSLIVNGTPTGNITYNRNLPTTNWYLISSPVIGESVVDFNTNNSTALGSGAGTSQNKALAFYDNTQALSTDRWSYYTVGQTDGVGGDDTTDNLLAGQGFTTKLTASADISFTGTMNVADVTRAVSIGAGNAYNLIGNPYPSFMNSGTGGFLPDNTARLTSQTLWVWDQGTNSYVTKVTIDDFKLAPGQGFLVECGSAGNVTFQEADQSHETDTFLRTTNSRPEIHVFMTDGTTSKFTKIYYINGTTTGFDNGYDGELFGGVANPFAVYTHLVSDSQGKDYQIQSLPDSNYENMIIPIGVNATAGTEITFTADVTNLPAGLNVYIENRTANTFTKLSDNGNYTITLNTDSNGIGQFYLRTSTSTLSVDNVILDNVSIYKTSSTSLRIAGLQQGNASIKIVNLLGKQMVHKSFTTNGVSDVSLPKLATGIYIVQLQTEKGKLNKKIIIE